MKTKIEKLALLICLIGAGIFSLNTSQAAINKQFNYQGKLTRPSDGQPVTNGSYNMVLRIYDAASGGNCLWSARGSCVSPTAKSVTVTSGIFTTILGESGDNALGLDFSTASYYLGVQVGSDAEMTPRRPITSVPQSFNSNGLIGDGLINLTSGSNTLLKLSSSGYLGIGTDTPNKLLHLKTASGTNAEMDVQSGSNNYWAMYQDDTTGDLRFWNNASNNLILKSNGNIGIGTTSMSGAKLDVYSTVPSSVSVANSTLYLRGSNNGYGLAMGTLSDGSTWLQGMLNDAASVPIQLNPSGGNVGIGLSTAPGVKLDIAQNGALRVGSAYLSSGGAGYTHLANHEWFNGSAWTNDGTAGVVYQQLAQTNTWFKHDIAGTHTQLMLLDSSGNLTANSFIYSSDQRLKKDIQPLTNDALAKIDQIQPVSFTWKDSGKKDIGFIAQNVEQVYPDLVTTDPNTGMKGLKYGNMTAVLMEAIKEQQQQIDQLKQEVEDLKK
jgi:hypothetical protein